MPRRESTHTVEKRIGPRGSERSSKLGFSLRVGRITRELEPEKRARKIQTCCLLVSSAYSTSLQNMTSTGRTNATKRAFEPKCRRPNGKKRASEVVKRGRSLSPPRREQSSQSVVEWRRRSRFDPRAKRRSPTKGVCVCLCAWNMLEHEARRTD